MSTSISKTPVLRQALNIRRYIYFKGIDENSLSPNIKENPDSNAVKLTCKIAEERQKYIASEKLFDWRVNYINWNHVYSDTRFSIDGSMSYISQPFEINDQNIFTKGGLAFVRDTFNYHIFDNESYVYESILQGFYKHAKTKYLNDLTIDDVADAAVSKIYHTRYHGVREIVWDEQEDVDKNIENES